MSTARSQPLALVAVGLTASIALKVLAVVLVVSVPQGEAPDGLTFLIWAPGVHAFALVGAVVAARRPGNPIGWIFLAVGVAEPFSTATETYVRVAPLLDLPAAAVIGAIGSSVNTSVLAALMLIVLLFPTGRPPSARWRPLVAAIGVWFSVMSVAALFAAGPISETMPIDNPIAAPGAVGRLMADLRSVADLSGAALLLASAPALGVRWRRADAIERAQLKWFAYALIGLVVIVIVVTPLWTLLEPVPPVLDALFEAVLVVIVGAIPVSAGIAILRYRLYDIDVVIRRTVVYATVIGILALVYVSLILALQAALSGLTRGDAVPVALSTLATVALFGRVRSAVRTSVDRRFYRSRYDSERALAAFAAGLRGRVELDAVEAALVDFARVTVAPATAGVWLRRLGPATARGGPRDTTAETPASGGTIGSPSRSTSPLGHTRADLQAPEET